MSWKPTLLAAVLGLATVHLADGWADVTRALPYPQGKPSADEIARQVYFVNHFFAVKNFSIEDKGEGKITVILTRGQGETPLTNTVERHLNNDYHDGETKSKDLAIFHSGKLKGTGMLITDFMDEGKSQSYAIWLPALRKIRRFAEPAHDDAWGGTDFTFGDVTLRKPRHETHELLGEEKFAECLMAMQPSPGQVEESVRLHPPACDHKGKAVYKLKSTALFPNWWYDYRISYVDTKTFGDYRSEYFKGDKKILVIDRDWGSMKLSDPRGLFWKYWYGKNLVTNHETMANIPTEVVTWDTDKDERLWSEQTLSKINR